MRTKLMLHVHGKRMFHLPSNIKMGHLVTGSYFGGNLASGV